MLSGVISVPKLKNNVVIVGTLNSHINDRNRRFYDSRMCLGHHVLGSLFGFLERVSRGLFVIATISVIGAITTDAVFSFVFHLILLFKLDHSHHTTPQSSICQYLLHLCLLRPLYDSSP